MMNLFEIMQSAQNGQAMQNLARAYGLSLQQTQAAIEALLPAFTMGLQRQTQNPQAFGSLAQMMTASPYARFFEAPSSHIPPEANVAGLDVLSRIFGSQEVAQAVAAQAAATSGVSMAIMKQIMPVIAAMLMGGLSKTASNEGLGGMLGQFAEMMRGAFPGMQPAAPPPPPPQAPFNPMDAILRGMFGQAAAAPPPQGQTGAGPNDPFGGMFGQILGGMFGGMPPATGAAGQSAPPPRPEPEPQAASSAGSELPPGPGSIGLDALNQMFEHGRQIQDEHQKAMKSILDAMLGGGQPPRS
ncbi:DUF937 domain-containing protein [Bosea sp. (in: a-proteobacteria)]|uniref:DUF937 domain-containing protein n=1 Tax=Bosea sp. (in: a-proteobacteria) TaxID=1871050 RepID=UPI003B3B6F62